MQTPERTVAATVIGSIALLALTGCVTSRVEQTKNAATGISADESVVILPTSYHSGNRTEDVFLRCVSEELAGGRSGIRVQERSTFVDAMFPWFEPRTMPQQVESLPDLLAKPGVAERIGQQGVRYLVWVNGNTEETAGGGGLSCAASTVGGGCFGLVWWENQGSYEASVWDIREGVAAGRVTTDTHGTSMVPAIVIPVPLIARTKTAACKDLARELRQFISEGEPT